MEKGIKESKELLVGVNELSIVLIKHLKDGVQLGKDLAGILSDLMADEDVQQKLKAAVEGASAVSGEIKDLSLEEGVELGLVQVHYVQKLVEALQNKEDA